MEIEFVASFLRGLRDPKQRNVLFKKMQSMHPVRTGSKGYEIICKWEDVGDALKDANLIPADGTERPAKKRRRMLIPMDD